MWRNRGEKQPKINPDEPVVIFKVGVLGSLPLDTMPLLADKLPKPTVLVSSDEIRRGIIDDAIRHKLELDESEPVSVDALYVRLGAQAASAFMDKATKIPLPVLRERVGEVVMPNLGAGNTVVLDAFYNSVPTRELPTNWGNTYGAGVVAVCVHTPHEVIRERITEWTKDHALPVPDEYYNRPAMAIATDMMRPGGVVQPQQYEGVHYSVHVQGAADAEQIVTNICTELNYAGMNIRL